MKSNRFSRLSIASGIIGSSLVVFIISSVYSDFYRQPNISFRIEDVGHDDSEMKATIFVTNSGAVAASNIRVTWESGSKIINYTPVDGPEEIQVSSKTNSKLVIAKLPRLAPNTESSINTTVGWDGSDSIYYTLRATYDQGSTKSVVYSLNGKEAIDIEEYYSNLIASKIIPLYTIAIALALSITSFLTPLIVKRLKNIDFKISQKRFASGILKEAERVRDKIQDDILLDYNFSTRTWDSKPFKLRNQMIHDFNDYNPIDLFYTALKQRNFDLNQLEMTSDQLKKHNEKCLECAKIIIENVKWKQYVGGKEDADNTKTEVHSR